MTEEICEIKHRELDRRLIGLEVSLQSELKDLYAKIDGQTLVWAERAAEFAKRPGWATLTIITVLSSITCGLIVASAFK